MNRMMLEFSRIDTLEGVTRTAYNQYESLILPLKNFLEKHEVDFILDKTVTDIDFVRRQRHHCNCYSFDRWRSD